MIPTGSRSRTTATSGAPATVTFIAVAVIFYLLDAFGIVEGLVPRFAQINVLVEEGEWWRIFTVVLLHGSITHILFNMWALWALGPQIERGVGTWPFISLFLASAGVGGVFAYYLGDQSDDHRCRRLGRDLRAVRDLAELGGFTEGTPCRGGPCSASSSSCSSSMPPSPSYSEFQHLVAGSSGRAHRRVRDRRDLEPDQRPQCGGDAGLGRVRHRSPGRTGRRHLTESMLSRSRLPSWERQ